jgi:putative cell wall-binding protein
MRNFGDSGDGMLRKIRGLAVVAVTAVCSVIAVAGTASASPTVIRFQGADRYATSAAIVDANYAPGVPVAYVATGLNFPDALAGGAAAANAGGPLLLVRPTDIPSSVATELTRLKPGRIVVLGGVLAVGASVATALQAYTTGTVTRVAGADRYQTAASLAAGFATGSRVYIATGVNFPDALAATAAAAAQHAAILLTDPFTLPTATAQALSTLAPSSITIVGATGAVSANVAQQLNAYSSTVTRISGADRYATAAAIAASAFPAAKAIYLAAGGGFADALTGGPAAGASGQPLLLAAPTCLPAPTASEVSTLAPTAVTLLGGTAALSTGVETLTTCAAAPPPPTVDVPAGAPYLTFSATLTEGGAGTGYSAYINAHDANANAISVGIQTDSFSPQSHGVPSYIWERVQGGHFTYAYLGPASNTALPVTLKWWQGAETAVFYAGTTAIASVPVQLNPRLFFGIEGDARINGDSVNDTISNTQITVGTSCPTYCGLNGAWNTASFGSYGLAAHNTNGQPQNGANFAVTGTVAGLPAGHDWDSDVVSGIGMIAQYWAGQ